MKMFQGSVFAVVIFTFILCGLGFSNAAYAARTATVDIDNTEMLRGPQKGSGLLIRLKKGQKVAASNYPTEGYYKVRVPDGTLGWVKADSLILGPMPDLRTRPEDPLAPEVQNIN